MVYISEIIWPRSKSLLHSKHCLPTSQGFIPYSKIHLENLKELDAPGLATLYSALHHGWPHLFQVMGPIAPIFNGDFQRGGEFGQKSQTSTNNPPISRVFLFPPFLVLVLCVQ